MLLSDGVPVLTVSRRLGHAKIQITLDFYGHLMPGDDEVAVDAFDGLLAARFERASSTDSGRKTAATTSAAGR